MLFRWTLILVMLVIGATANADQYDTTASYVCSVSYEPSVGKLSDGGIPGKSGYLFVRFDKEPNCTWAAFDRFVTYCSKGATSSMCAKTGLYEPFALQLLYGSLIQALSNKTPVYNHFGDCMTGSNLCIYSTTFARY